MKSAGARIRTRGAVWLVALIVLAGAALALRRPALQLRGQIAFEQAVLYANRHRSAPVPLASDGGPLVRWIALWLLPPNSALDAAAHAVDRDTGDAVSKAHTLAIAELLEGRPVDAVNQLEAISASRRTATMWSNLGSSEIAVASGGNRAHLLTALVAANHALTLRGDATAPHFIRASALESLNLRRASIVAWRQYLARDATEPWAAVARRHAAALAGMIDDSKAWRGATTDVEKLSPAALAALARAYPQQARTFAEAVYLGDWADAVEKGDREAAKASLTRIATIAEVLQSNGELFLADVLAAIEAADHDRARHIARAFITYRSGRRATNEQNPAKALPRYEEAQRLFASHSNPIAAMSECYTAIALIDLNRSAEARQRLTALISQERASGARHQALLAFALYHLALCDAAEGSWTESLAAAQESLSIFARHHEKGLGGTVEALIAQCYAFLGQPDLAVSHGTHAVASLAAAGDLRRARITVGGLSRSALRHGDWESAQVLGEVEQLTSETSVSRDDCDMFLRLAAAEYHLGHPEKWQRALADARDAARKTLDAAIRGKLVADTDAVEGALVRSKDPQKAIALLSAAIRFQEQAGRALPLPQLYLERGRANVDLGRSDDALADFECGIGQLEQQRTRTADADLRAGIFDDAAELFADAVKLSLARRDVARAFAYVERSRARTIAEEIARNRQEPLATISVERLIENVPADGLIVEYQIAGDGIVILTLARDGLAAARITVSRAVVHKEVQALVDALRNRADPKTIDAASARLFARLIEPVRYRVAKAHVLIVVPDALLQQLPFAALIDPGTRRYLVQDHVVIGVPSASVFATGVQRNVDHDHAVGTSTALLVANPLLYGGPFSELESLPGSEQEARNAARSYGDSTVVTRAAATVQRLLSDADGYDVVHFAGHTVIRPGEPWHSALLLAPDRGDRGILSVQQIAHQSFRRTRTVVLASCSTLRGHTAGVEGVPSVARAFLLAGVSSVVGTLWDIDDGEAGPIVEALHRQLARRVPAAQALRASQLQAIHSPRAELRHPSLWSAFAVLATREALK